jgi:hypothetical protein
VKTQWKLSLLALVVAALVGCGGSSNSSGGSGGGGDASAYPAAVQKNYLKACEVKSPSSVCHCTLSWIEKRVSLSKFTAADRAVRNGKKAPSWVYAAVRACVKKS